MKEKPKAFKRERSTRRKETEQPREAGNLAAAAVRLGCSVSDLKRAKASGCDGFEHGRIWLDKVRAWLEANPPNEDDLSEDALKRRKLLAQCKKLELDEAITKGEYTPNHEVVSLFSSLGEQNRSEWLALVAEVPLWAGLNSAEMQDKARVFVDRVLCSIFSNDRMKRYA